MKVFSDIGAFETSSSDFELNSRFSASQRMSSFVSILFSVDSLFFDAFSGNFSHCHSSHFGFPLLFDGDDQINQPIRSQSRNSGLSGLQGNRCLINLHPRAPFGGFKRPPAGPKLFTPLHCGLLNHATRNGALHRPQ
jgi:hypothetical protein